MKKFLFIAIFSFSLTSLGQIFAQEVRYDTLAYLFPKLSEGKFTLKDGGQLTTLFNYGYHWQDLLYYDTKINQVLQVDNLQDILLIRTGDRYFIPILTGIGELIIYGDICLVYYKKLKMSEVTKSTSYGPTSTAAIKSNIVMGRPGQHQPDRNITYYSTTNSEQISLSDRVEAGEIKIVVQEDFYLSEIGETKVVPLTKKNLIKKFPTQVSFIESYFAEHKPNLQNKHTAVLLINMLNERNK